MRGLAQVIAREVAGFDNVLCFSFRQPRSYRETALA
jgi:hypothetical protein